MQFDRLPLVDLLKGCTVPLIQEIMVKVMPIVVAPKLRKEELIGQLLDYACGSDCLVDVWAAVVKKKKLKCLRGCKT